MTCRAGRWLASAGRAEAADSGSPVSIPGHAAQNVQEHHGPDLGTGGTHGPLPHAQAPNWADAGHSDPDRVRGAIKRRTVDTTGHSDAYQWEELAERALAVPLPYRPTPGGAVYHLRVDDRELMAAEHDLTGPLQDLVTAVMALGDTVLAALLRCAIPVRVRA